MMYPVEHQPGRFTPGRFTPGRFTLGRFIRSLVAAGHVLRQAAGCLGPGVSRQRRGSIALVAGVVIAGLASMTAVAVDLGTVYLAKVGNQRVADSAAFAGALAYNASSSTTTMNGAIANLVALNGLPAGAAVASLGASPSGDGNNAVKVIVTTSSPLYLAEIFQSKTTASVVATSYAEVKPNASACIIALLTKAAGVVLSGGTSVTAASCAVASNSVVSVPCGTTITTKTVDYNSASAPSQPCSGIKPPAGTTSVNIIKVATIDPLAANTAVAAAFTHLAAVAKLSGPSGPTLAGGSSMTFGYTSGASNAPQTQLTAIGCTGSFSSPTWTVTCPAGGTYQFGSIITSGGIALNFAVSGSATNTYDINGAINIGGSGANFGPGTYNIAGGIIVGGGSNTTFAAGTYDIGPGSVGCNGSSYSICNTGSSLTFGAGSYTIAGGIYNGGGATLGIGAGSSSNSFTIGAGSAGYAINATGTSMTLGNMSTGTFRAVGNISTGGGTSFTMSAAPAHDLYGTFALAGSATLGAGTYTVAGSFTLGNGGGGGTVIGSSVTIITSGTYSVAAGYTNVTLTAPTSGTLQDLVVASNAAAGASFSEGASGNSLSGAFYFPIGPITLSGAGSVGNGAGQCLELIGASVALSGGSTLASSCSGLAGSVTGGSVLLVE
jgi:hypothetical protein